MFYRAIVCVLIGCSPAVAQQPEAPKPAVIEGTITNSKTGEPVRRVAVTLRPSVGAAGSAGGVAGAIPGQAAPYATTTAADGKFRIEGVEAGSYYLGGERQGFIRKQFGARRQFVMGTVIKIAAGQELKFDFQMTPQAVLNGRVLDEEGEPVANAFVQVAQERFLRGQRELIPQGGAQTNDTGEFRVSDLSPGRYYVCALRARRWAMSGEGPPRNPSNKPEEEYLTTFYPGVADRSEARPIDVVAGQVAAGLDIPLRKGVVYRISGKVTSLSGGAGAVRLILYERDRRGGMMGMGGAGGTTKADGTFVIGYVAPGSYFLSSLSTGSVGRVAVDVGRENVENVVLTVSPGATITGTTRFDTDSVQAAEAKKLSLSGLRVVLMTRDGLPMNPKEGSTNDDGTFSVANVGPEKFWVSVVNLPSGTYVKSIRAGTSDVLEEFLDVTTGTAPAPLVITLGVGSGTISGAVRDDKGDPAPSSTVSIAPDPMKQERSDLFRTVTTDQTGQFTLANVPPGDYKIYAWEDIEPGAWSDAAYLKPFDSKAQKVKVDRAGSTQTTVVCIPAANAAQ